MKKPRKAAVSSTGGCPVRCIRFNTLCANCKANGENRQEYGRMCVPREQCIITRGKKTPDECPIWRTLNAPNNILRGPGDLTDG